MRSLTLAGTTLKDITPLVSIITPTYNRATLLPQAIDSILAQQYPHWELIITDDGSIDETQIIVAKYVTRYPQIRYLRFPENRGISAARNAAIRVARGGFLAFLDADDIYLSHALGVLVQALVCSRPQIDLVYGNFMKFFEGQGRFQPIRTTSPQPRPGLFFQFLLPEGNPICPSATMVRKEAVVRAGMFDESFTAVEDRELWIRMIMNGCQFQKIETQIAIYRKHANQLTKQTKMRRFQRDRASFRFLNWLGPEKLFPKSHTRQELAQNLTGFALEMIKGRTPCFDSALFLLHNAQKQHPNENRKRLIYELEAGIPQQLKNMGPGGAERIDWELEVNANAKV